MSRNLAWCVCILGVSCASSVVAAPTVKMDVVRNAQGRPQLNSAGDWQWLIEIRQDAAVVGSIAAELGFRLSGSDLVGAPTIETMNFDKDIPGNFIFGWETPNGGQGNAFPSGLQSNQNPPSGALAEIFSAYGSVDFGAEPGLPGDDSFKNYLQFVTQGPSTAPGRSLSTSVLVMGSGPGMTGKVAEVISESPLQTAIFRISQQTVSRSVRAGDANFDGVVSGVDLSILSFNFGAANPIWTRGDFDDNGAVNTLDYDVLGANFDAPAPPPPIGSPAPSTASLVATNTRASTTGDVYALTLDLGSLAGQVDTLIFRSPAPILNYDSDGVVGGNNAGPTTVASFANPLLDDPTGAGGAGFSTLGLSAGSSDALGLNFSSSPLGGRLNGPSIYLGNVMLPFLQTSYAEVDLLLNGVVLARLQTTLNVPEPTAALLLGLAVVGGMSHRRRAQR